MKQALEALERGETKLRYQAITALRAAIEQAEKQEPHSLLCVCGAEWDIYPDGKEVLASTAPRQWQGLTDEEVSEILDREIGFNSCFGPETDFARAVEAKLKEKNT